LCCSLHVFVGSNIARAIALVLLNYFLLITSGLLYHYFLLRLLPPPRSTLFPYTTLFRSRGQGRRGPGRIHLPLRRDPDRGSGRRSEEHTSELQSRVDLVCRLLLEKKKYEKIKDSAESRTSRLDVRCC